MSVRATVTVPLPVSVVESNLWDVTTWSHFLSDVEEVRRASHERYIFALRAGRSRHEVLVAVRWRARDHRFAWKAFEGPAWGGELRLTALNGRRTRVYLEVTAHPRTFGGHLAEMVGAGRRDPASDLVLLQERLAKLPRPIRPSRLATSGTELTVPSLEAADLAAPPASYELIAASRPDTEAEAASTAELVAQFGDRLEDAASGV